MSKLCELFANNFSWDSQSNIGKKVGFDEGIQKANRQWIHQDSKGKKSARGQTKV